jgi:hypothetical protein
VVLQLLPVLGGWQEIPILERLAAGEKAGNKPDVQRLAQQSLEVLRKKHPSYAPSRWYLLRPLSKSRRMEGKKEQLLHPLADVGPGQKIVTAGETTDAVCLRRDTE